MRYLALASDYDGTLARDGRVDDSVIAALESIRSTGRKLILVSGRILSDLERVFPRINLFDMVVAENGAILYRPADGSKTLPTTSKIPRPFIDELKARGVSPLVEGDVIVATWEPNEGKVLSTIRDLGLELDVVFNKGAVMILPAGVNKGSGLGAALKELQLSAHNVVGIGDAENDHAFLQVCECSAAVANALDSIKEHVDVVMTADHGAGVAELIRQLEADDLAAWLPRLSRHDLRLGSDRSGNPIGVAPFGSNIMLAGPSGTGKTTLATGILEDLVDRVYQFCLFDPEGDYEGFKGPIEIGGLSRAPDPAEIMEAFQQPERSVSVNLLGVPLESRPAFLARLIPMLQDLRARYGRPHQLVIDESHHMLPKDSDLRSWESVQGAIFITVDPDSVAAQPLQTVDVLVATGKTADQTIERFARAVGVAPPTPNDSRLNEGDALVWNCRTASAPPIAIRLRRGKKPSPRHRRKYAEAELPEDRSFYFRGPDQKLNLRAQNLKLFIQIAAGVDDESWLHHLHRQDYSRWVKEALKDDSLANEIGQIETDCRDSVNQSRTQIFSAIERRYTAPG
jgi:hydroxymethylpyrimidine pyrophosphatase-like HAD family hydrolase